MKLSFLMDGLIFLAVLARAAGWSVDESPVPQGVWALLAGYGAAILVQYLLARRGTAWTTPILLVKAGLILAMLWVAPLLDFLTMLFLPFSFQVVQHFGTRVGFTWIVGFNLAIAGMLLRGMEWQPGLVMVLLSACISALVGSYAVLIARTGQARQENERLAAELVAANRRIAEQAAQQEALAAAEERRRLVAELHDSLTQTLFSMNLAGQAALVSAPQGQAGPHLQRLQSLAAGAAGEVQALTGRAYPPQAGDSDLAALLGELAAGRRAADGLQVLLEITGQRALPEDQARRVYHIVQEALNNVAKHAGTPFALVRLDLGPPLCLEVVDHGRGFDRQAPGFRPGFGLAGMQAQADRLGWRLQIDSQPGQGAHLSLQEPQQ